VSTSRAVRQRQVYIAAGANVVFVLSLFLPWFALGSYDSINGWSALPAPWLILIVAIVALAALVAEVYQMVLPLRLDPLGVAAYASSIPLWFTVSSLIGGGGTGRDWGLFVALIAAVVATVFSAQLWRGLRR
jgi:hypothetical protein